MCDVWCVVCVGVRACRYQTFKKITSLEYEMPPQMPAKAKAFVEALLVLDPNERLGSEKHGGYVAIPP